VVEWKVAKKTGNRGEPEAKDSIRTFVCIEIPASVKQRMEDLESELRRVDAQVSWVKPSNVHLTLKFLGGVAKDRIDAVSTAAEHAAQVTGPFGVEIGGTGCFPSARNPRVLWIGLTRLPDELTRLHSSLEQEMASEGFEREAKRFSPHLTIGRLRSPRNSAELAEKLAGTGFEPESFVAREIIVMRSEPKPTGSIYTPLRIITLV
jgi:2'-5' RNA ligase